MTSIYCIALALALARAARHNQVSGAGPNLKNSSGGRHTERNHTRRAAREPRRTAAWASRYSPAPAARARGTASAAHGPLQRFRDRRNCRPRATAGYPPPRPANALKEDSNDAALPQRGCCPAALVAQREHELLPHSAAPRPPIPGVHDTAQSCLRFLRARGPHRAGACAGGSSDMPPTLPAAPRAGPSSAEAEPRP
jgi:hypothetical protein